MPRFASLIADQKDQITDLLVSSGHYSRALASELATASLRQHTRVIMRHCPVCLARFAGNVRKCPDCLVSVRVTRGF